MMKTRKFRGVLAITAASTLLLAACGEDEEPTVSETTQDETAGDEEMTDEEMTDEEMDEGTESTLTLQPFGDACSAIPSDGEGSSEGMSDDPAATAASNNPVLSTLVTAVDAAGLVDTVNGLESATVFAPYNDAFNAFSEEELNGLLEDTEALTGVLTLHVIGGQSLTADELVAGGDFATVAGPNVSVSGSMDAGVTVTGPSNSANVICGNVQTANATVHIIDAVLLPASS